ncbi:MAG TPA: Mu-like prophage major head subunit gpT family protein [Quisquiliibacterium sp.]|nr:Mu-like prophage major head subunit gpT family protein [Quisquiliibacterium sp.]
MELMHRHAAQDLVVRAAPMERLSVDQDRRVVSVSLSSETPVMRFGEAEVLSHDAGAVDLTRTEGGLPLLFNHNRDQPLGIVERVRIERRRLVGDLRFGTSALAAEVYSDVVAGILTRISIGYTPMATEGIDGGYLVKRWQLFEASVVTVPADPTVGVGRSAGPELKGRSLMDKEVETLDRTASDERAPNVTHRASVEAEIRSLAQLARLPELADDMIRRGVDVPAARRELLNRMAAEDERIPTRSAHVPLGFVSVEAATAGGVETRELMAEAIAYRFGGIAPRAGNPYLSVRVAELARELLELRGISARRLTPVQVIERAHGVSDFPELLAGAGNRILRAAYEAAPAGIRQIARQATAVDFRAKQTLMLGEAPELKKVDENGEFTRGTIAEAAESYSLSTYGRIFGISRQALVNDDLGAFADLTRRFARSAMEVEAKLLVTLVTSNPTMADGVAVFHANHGNLAASGGAISTTTLGPARSAMRLQKGLDGSTPINATPRYLVVPAALETAAEQVLSTIYAATVATANPFTGRLDLVVDPRLDAVSTSAWYVFADPAVVDTIEYSYLESEQGPVLQTRAGFDVDGLEVKCRLDFGCGFLDHRGAYKNPG